MSEYNMTNLTVIPSFEICISLMHSKKECELYQIQILVSVKGGCISESIFSPSKKVTKLVLINFLLQFDEQYFRLFLNRWDEIK